MDAEAIKKLVEDTVKSTMETFAKEIKSNKQEQEQDAESQNKANIHRTIMDSRNRDKAAEELIKREKEDAVFISTIYNEIDANRVFLPEDTKKIVDACMEAGDTDNYKAELIKKEVTQRVFEIQDNMDKLSEPSKKKVKEYLSLTDEARLAKARDIWPLVSEVVNVKKNLYSQDERRKQKNGISISLNSFSSKQESIIKDMKDVLLGIKKLDY